MTVRPAYEVYSGDDFEKYIGSAAAIVTSDSNAGDATAKIMTGIYVGTGGDVSVVLAGGDGTAVVFKAVPTGTILDGLRAIRVTIANTTASNMVALYGSKT